MVRQVDEQQFIKTFFFILFKFNQQQELSHSFSVTDFLKDQFTTLNLIPQDLSGKTVVVTGSDVGIGYGTICHLVGMHPARVILACRNTTKAEEAIHTIKATSTINSEGVILEAQELNLASFASCRAFVKKYQESGHPLHILINNAGIGSRVFSLTEDKHEAIPTSFATNHLGTVFLTLLLLPVLRKTVQESSTYPRIVVVSSDLHKLAKFPEKDSTSIVQDMDDPNNIPSFKERYRVSKLMNVLFTRSLALHLKESTHPEDQKITVSVINPGLVSTELGTKSDEPLRNRIGFTVVVGLMRGLVGRSVMEGAKTTVYAAIAPECGIENGAESGVYYSNCQVIPVSPVVEGEAGKALGEKLWKETIQTIEVTPNEFGV